MPAAAVTPASEAYIKVVAVKKLVVGSGSHGYMLVRTYEIGFDQSSGVAGLVVVQPFCRVCLYGC